MKAKIKIKMSLREIAHAGIPSADIPARRPLEGARVWALRMWVKRDGQGNEQKSLHSGQGQNQ